MFINVITLVDVAYFSLYADKRIKRNFTYNRKRLSSVRNKTLFLRIIPRNLKRWLRNVREKLVRCITQGRVSFKRDGLCGSAPSKINRSLRLQVCNDQRATVAVIAVILLVHLLSAFVLYLQSRYASASS